MASLAAPEPALTASTGQISGTITLPSGYTTSGLTITAVVPSMWPSFTGTIDSSGAYSITGLDAGTYYVWLGGASDLVGGYYPNQTEQSSATLVTVTTGGTTSGINFAPVVGGKISGKVTLPNGYTTDNLSVSATAVVGLRYASGTLNSDGTYEFKGLAAGSYKVQLSSYGDLVGGYYPGQTTSDLAAAVPVTAGTTTTGINFAPVVGGKITGKVTLPSGQTTTNLYINAQSSDSSGGFKSGPISADGTYSISGLGSGSYKVQLSSWGDLVGGYYPGQTTSDLATPVAVTAGATTSGINFAPVVGGKITGTITLPSGQTTTNLYINAESSDSSGGSKSGSINPDGTYSISGLGSGSYKVQLSSSGDLVGGYYPGQTTSDLATAVAITAGATKTGIDFAPVVGGKITGTITLPTGQTTTNLYVSANSVVGSRYASGTIHSDGTYELKGLAAGNYKVQLMGISDLILGYYPGQTTSDQATAVVVAAGATTTGINFAPVVGGKITGTITLPVGETTTGLSISATGATSKYGTIASNGSYSITGLPTGSYKVELSSSNDVIGGYYPNQTTYSSATTIPIAVGATVPNINFAPVVGAKITGKITLPTGQTTTGLSISVSSESGYYHSGTISADGTYTVRGLEAGNYRVGLWAYQTDLIGGYYPNQTSFAFAEFVSVAAGSTVSGINFAPVLGGAISGKVSVPAGYSVSGMSVSASGFTNGTSSTSGTVKADGTYSIRGLDAGRYRVNLYQWPTTDLVLGTYPSGSEVASAVTVTRGATTSGIDFTAAVGGKITGRVTLPAGGSLQGMTIRVQGTSWWSTTSTVAADGTYTATGLPSGRYQVILQDGGDVVGYYPGATTRLRSQAVSATVGKTTVGIDMVVAPAAAGAISGTINAPSGVDRTSLNVTVEEVASGVTGEATPTANGSYSVTGLPAGRYRVFLGESDSTPYGYYPGLVDWESATLVVVGSATVTGIDFSPPAVGSITGRVTSPSGDPVTAGAVQAYRADDGDFADSVSLEDDGTYTFDRLTPGTYRVWAGADSPAGTHAGYAPDGWSDPDRASTIVVVASGVAHADVRLKRSGTISGTVRNGAGTGLAGVTVYASGGDGSGRATTAADGSYTISSDLGAGSFTVSFSSLSYAAEYYSDGRTLSSATDVVLTEGGSRSGVNAVLEGSATLVVHPLDPTTHEPVGNQGWPDLLTASGDDGLPPTSSTTTDDGFVVTGLHAGSLKLGFARASADTPYVAQYFSAPSGSTTSWNTASAVSLTAGQATTVTLTLATGAKITGKVVNPDGTPVIRQMVVAVSDDEEARPSRFTTTDDDGTYTIQGLLPGSYSVAVPNSSILGGDTFYGTGVAPANANVVVTGTATTSGIDITVTTPFTDIQPGASFASDIAWLGDAGITRPGADGKFGPSGSVSRAAMAAFLYRAAGSPAYTAPTTTPFTDVKTTDAFYKEMSWLASQGITKPGADGKFGPNDPVSRQAMAAFLYRFAGSPTYTAPSTTPFSDVKTTDAFYKEMSWLASKGITKPGADGRFAPVDPVRREAMAAFLHRADTAGLI